MKRSVMFVWRGLFSSGLVGCHSADAVCAFATVAGAGDRNAAMVDVPPAAKALLVALVVAIGGALYLMLRGRRSRHMVSEQQHGASSAPSGAVPGQGTDAAAFEELRGLITATRQRHNLDSNSEAFTYAFLTGVLQLNDQATRTAITSGSGNSGIDAIHIDRKGAQVPGCEYGAAHIIACDYVEDISQTRLPISRERVELIANTWVAIAASTDHELQLNAALRRQIKALHRYWRDIVNDAPHQIHVVTNRARSVVDRDWMEKRMNYFASHDYHYYDLADLVSAYRAVVERPTVAGSTDPEGTETSGVPPV